MPPKQDSHSDRISALEGQIVGFTTAIDELREATAKTERSIVEATAKSLENNRHAEERHAQLVEMFMNSKNPNPKPMETEDRPRVTVEVPLSAIRDLCDPYLNLFRNIIPPVFDTLDVSPLLAFGVLGTLGSILNNSR
uniref:Uncharacterized protein n=1 Tax=Brassica oleracea var. oleracea TaxID=109376 RepID=A0A0D3DK54_BRAOL